jgi:CarD family transcriptional regulator
VAKAAAKPAAKAAAKPAAKAAAKPAAKKPVKRKAAAPKPIVKMNLVAKKSGGKRAPLAPMTSVVKEVANAPKAAPKKAAAKVKIEFSTDEFVVYPTHGVGKITGIEEQEVSGMKLQVFVIDFAEDKMTLRVPLGKAKTSGMRRLSTVKEMDVALTTLKGRARVKRTMWSRRAQEYEAKINSGDPILIAEVVRDLHRSSNQPDQSYSERQIYEAALGRLARELAAVEKTDEDSATEKLEGVLQAA